MSNGRIPDRVIEAVLKHHDIVDVVGKYVHLSKQGHYLKGLCPFHSEKTPSFTVTPEKQIYHCFGCQAGGNVINFVMEIEGYSFGEAVRQLAEEAGIDTGELPGTAPTEQQTEFAKLYEANELSAKWYHHVLTNTEQGKPAMAYLRSRGLSDKWIEMYQLGYGPPMWDKLTQFLDKRGYALPLMEQGGLVSARSEGGYVDKFRDRVMFPICDWKGRVIAFAGRAMGDVQPKYLNSPESKLFNKGRSLFNLHRARPAIRKSRQIVLLEGYLDVIKTWEAGIENGVATMGTSLTADHVEVLRRNADEAIVCYDGDGAGQNAANKAIGLLENAGLHVRIAMIPDGLDPDEFVDRHGADRFRRDVMEAAVPAVKFKLLYKRKHFNLQDVDGKFRYMDEAAKIIAEAVSPVEREHYMKELAADFQYSFDTIKQQVNEARQLFLKKRQFGDNNEHSWNNVINNGNRADRVPSLLPAYINAERKLLAAMMHDREITEHVRRQLDDHFNQEAHAAIAAYLYAYYARGNEPDPSRFIGTLQDERLEREASSLLTQETNSGVNSRVIDDYIREIRKLPLQKAIEQLLEQQASAAREKNVMEAARIAKEIIALRNQLKSM